MKVGDRVIIYRNKESRTGLSSSWVGDRGAIVAIDTYCDLSHTVAVESGGQLFRIHLPASYLKREK